jgi:hypothetical protein
LPLVIVILGARFDELAEWQKIIYEKAKEAEKNRDDKAAGQEIKRRLERNIEIVSSEGIRKYWKGTTI